uniref:K Homology domain-containing protein n=1 Tax=Zooxanthella nutricula TaxID=1333877 RepID=A0A7S2KJ16_9DINO|mmetsp:Transcript_47774/g.145316  ORF Transcript_47774/g.145316 Transcript_47774/m.145316 type:complete len:221 (+) Transcript_47774:3-665(+)
MKQIAATVGCQVRTTPRERVSNNQIIITGNYAQCAIVQELVRSRLADALRTEGMELPDQAEVVLFVRAEAAGVVTGKQQFKLRQIRKESGASIQLQPETIKGQRPCVLRGPFQSVLRAERHVFDLVRAVPVVAKEGGPDLPRSRIRTEPVCGEVLCWKGHFGWIQPDEEIDHPQAAEHQGHIYVHQKDLVQGGSLKAGQRVMFHVYSDFAGLGAEECFAS